MSRDTGLMESLFKGSQLSQSPSAEALGNGKRKRGILRRMGHLVSWFLGIQILVRDHEDQLKMKSLPLRRVFETAVYRHRISLPQECEEKTIALRYPLCI
jgi:hypothetical protein